MNVLTQPLADQDLVKRGQNSPWKQQKYNYELFAF